MPFYHHIHCKYTRVKGFVNLYEYALRYSYMITEKAKCKAKVISFWEKHGLEACLDAFPVKRSTLFLWKKKLKENDGKLESLNDQSKSPRAKRKRIWSFEIQQEIKRLREEYPNLGKDKLYTFIKPFCDQHNLSCPSSSTIGRLIKDAGGLRIFPHKISHFGKIKAIKRTKKLRKPKGFKATHPGHLVEIDTIVRIVNGTRCYIITFIDVYSRFTFAWAYRSHSSKASQDFFKKILRVFPYEIEYLQTDNGSEFAKHFANLIKQLHLTHYHIYPKTPQHQAHIERYNRTIQEEYIDYHVFELINLQRFNQGLIDYLIWYNTERPHWSLGLKSPLQFVFEKDMIPVKFFFDQGSQKSKSGWTYTKT